MKKLIILAVLMVFLVSAVMACAEPAPTPAPAPAPTPAPEKVFDLKFNDWGPAAIGIGKLHMEAAKMIEERTGGKVKITCYFSQALLKYGDTYRGVSSGITDISLYVLGATQGVHDINEVIALPFLGLPDMETGAQIYKELRQKCPELDQENAKTNTMWLDTRMMPPNQLHLVKKTAKVPEDLAGMKVIAGASFSDMLESVGAALIQLGPPDWYMALDRGLAQAHILHWCAAYEFKIQELFKYHTLWGSGGAGMAPIGFLVNLETWNSLPPDYQQIIVDTYTWVNEESMKYDLALIDTAVNAAKEAGHTLTYLTPEEIKPWADLMESYHEKWIKETEAKGWPAQSIYDEAKRLVAK